MRKSTGLSRTINSLWTSLFHQGPLGGLAAGPCWRGGDKSVRVTLAAPGGRRWRMRAFSGVWLAAGRGWGTPEHPEPGSHKPLSAHGEKSR